MYQAIKNHSIDKPYNDLPWMIFFSQEKEQTVIPATLLDKKRGLSNGATAKLWYKYRDELGYDIEDDIWTEKNKINVQTIKQILRSFYGYDVLSRSRSFVMITWSGFQKHNLNK
jgi:hypothetical protein